MADEDSKLDNLTALVTKLSTDIDTNMKGIREEMSGLRTQLNTVENSVDQKIEGLRKSLEEDIKQWKEESKRDVKARVDTRMRDVDDDIAGLKSELETAKKEIQRLTELIDTPFNPDRSVVIYGLEPDEELNDAELIEWLIEEILELKFKTKDVSRTKARGDGKVGVIKVEQWSTEDKIELLRAKKKCSEYDTLADVSIKGCESHQERVNRMNNKFLLSKIPGGDDFTITGHGIIKRKMDNKDKKDLNNAEGGDGSAVAEIENDSAEKATPEKVGDNTDPRAKSPSKQHEKKRESTNGSEADKPKKSGQSQRSKTMASKNRNPGESSTKVDRKRTTRLANR